MVVIFAVASKPSVVRGQNLEPQNEAALKASIQAAETNLSISKERAKRADEKLAKFKDLFQRDVVSRKEFEIVEMETNLAHQAIKRDEAILEAAKKDLETAIEVAAVRLEIEALTAQTHTGLATQFRGSGLWTEQNLADLQAAFEQQFHESLPVSAHGQTPAHDRLGLDHRDKVDVGVPPSSREGEWLTAYLRSRGFSYITFETRVAGSSTGAHVHIGAASPRKWSASAPKAATKHAVKRRLRKPL